MKKSKNIPDEQILFFELLRKKREMLLNDLDQASIIVDICPFLH